MSTIKINELATQILTSTNYFIHGGVSGVSYKNDLTALANFINTVGAATFRGSLAIADTPTLDGWYLASETGTYTNAGSLVIDLGNGLSIIIIETSVTVFSQVVIPLTQPTSSEALESNTTIAVNGRAVTDYTSKKPSTVVGKNLYDKSYTGGDGLYIVANTGVAGSNAVYTHSDYLPVLSSTDYVLNELLYSVVYYDSLKVYISGITPVSTTFSTPSNAKFVRITMTPLSKKETTQLELGTVATTYQAYSDKFPLQYLDTTAIDYLNDTDAPVIDTAASTGTADTSGFYGNRKDFFNGFDLQPVRLEIYSAVAGNADINYYKITGNTPIFVSTQAVVLSIGVNDIIVDESGLGFGTTPNDSIFYGVKPTAATGILKYKTGTGFDTFKITAGLAYTPFTTLEFSTQIITERDTQKQSTKIDDLTLFRDEIKSASGAIEITGANLQSLIIANDFLRLPTGVINISTPIVVPTGKRIEGVRGKTILQLTGGCVNALLIEDANNISINNITITGTNPQPNILSALVLGNDTQVKAENGIGTEKGIIFSGNSYDNNLENINFQSLSHSGIYVEHQNTVLYTGAFKGVNLKANSCYTGYYFDETGEFCELTNIESQNCNIGILSKTGNLMVSNSSFVYNRVGFAGMDGANDSHSSFSNCNFNHNKLYNLFTFNTEKGWFFNGCQIFEGVTWIENTTGFVFQGGKFRGEMTLTNGGVNILSNNMWAVNSVTKVGTTNLQGSNNYLISTSAPITL